MLQFVDGHVFCHHSKTLSLLCTVNHHYPSTQRKEGRAQLSFCWKNMPCLSGHHGIQLKGFAGSPGNVLKRRLKESAGLKAFESESSTVDGD